MLKLLDITKPCFPQREISKRKPLQQIKEIYIWNKIKYIIENAEAEADLEITLDKAKEFFRQNNITHHAMYTLNNDNACPHP